MSKFDKTVESLEIFSVGTHTDSQGMTNEFTDDDVDHMVEVFGGGYPEFVPIKLGHTSDEFNQKIASELGLPASSLNGENGEGLDGVAALGQVVSLTQKGNKLVADLKVPDAMAQLFADGYFRDVSCELSVDNEDRWILDGLAMLGAERPAVEDLAGIPAAAIHKKRPTFVGRRFSQPIPKKVKMSQDDKGKLDKILARFKSEDESLSFSELSDVGLKFGDDADKGAVKDAVRELQERSGMLDEVVGLLQQAIEITSSAVEEGDQIVEEDVAKEPAVAAKALVDRLSSFTADDKSKSKFKSDADFSKAVATEVDKATKTLTAKVDELTASSQTSSYRVETEKLVGMEGSPEELAKELADLEASAGKETADRMLASWKQVSKYAVDAGVVSSIGEDDGDGGGDPETSELQAEAAEYKKENPGVSDVQAQRFVNLRKMNAARTSGGKD
ncbi:MAG: hypothetical protein KAJ19_27990 [Gammaproteobacteria bacterium]|nr:hypothetical protein [Gammaproteobacteria bacterium]